jgi:hypothetical protein
VEQRELLACADVCTLVAAVPLAILVAILLAAAQLPGPGHPEPLIGDRVEVSTGAHMEFWGDGHYGPCNILSVSNWWYERPDQIRLTFCFGDRVVGFHWERGDLVIENSFEKGRYRRVAAPMHCPRN